MKPYTYIIHTYIYTIILDCEILNRQNKQQESNENKLALILELQMKNKCIQIIFIIIYIGK